MFLTALETFSLSYFSPVSSALLSARRWRHDTLYLGGFIRAARVLDCLADMVARRRGGKSNHHSSAAHVADATVIAGSIPTYLRGCRFADGGGFDVGAAVSQSGSRWLGVFCSRPLLWAALRFGRRGAVTAAFVTSGIALWGTVRDLGPFAESEPHESIFLLQLFIATITMTALVVAVGGLATAAFGATSENKRRCEPHIV